MPSKPRAKIVKKDSSSDDNESDDNVSDDNNSDNDSDNNSDNDSDNNSDNDSDNNSDNDSDNVVPAPVKRKNNSRKNQTIIFDKNGQFDLNKADNSAQLTYYANCVTKKLHDDLYEELLKEVPWTQGVYNMFGKPVKTPRLLYSMSDANFDVSKVYKVTKSMPWTKNMKKLKKIVEKTTGRTFMYAQLNYYRNGSDYIGYHTDSEVQPGDIVASISLGAERKFCFRSIKYKIDGRPTYETVLGKGSLITMDECAAKKHWKHALPKMASVKTGRINITFRPR